MATLLRIDSSSRLQNSHSRALGDQVEAGWRDAFPDGSVLYRDVARTPIEAISQETITGFFTPLDEMTPDLHQATALSDRLIGEVQAADTLLLTVPIYNFSVPAALKAWIDQIVRIGKTFAYDGAQFQGLAEPNSAIVCAAYGAPGYEAGGAFRAANFLEPYLEFLLGFLGISDIRFITLQATTADEAVVDAGLARARADIDRLVQSWQV